MHTAHTAWLAPERSVARSFFAESNLIPPYPLITFPMKIMTKMATVSITPSAIR